MMSKFRPECFDATTKDGPAIPDDTALFLIRESVAKRRELIFGKLHDGYGNHCAIGAFWQDNPKAVLHSSLIDEVAAVNDSVPPSATAKERWKKVNSWLRFKIASLSKRSQKAT
jgi:hypothetical protein